MNLISAGSISPVSNFKYVFMYFVLGLWLTFLCILFEALVGYISTAEDEVSTDLRLPEDMEALRSDLYTWDTLMKKENLIFLIYKEIQNGAVAKSYMTNGLLIDGEIFAHFLIY